MKLFSVDVHKYLWIGWHIAVFYLRAAFGRALVGVSALFGLERAAMLFIVNGNISRLEKQNACFERALNDFRRNGRPEEGLLAEIGSAIRENAARLHEFERLRSDLELY